MEKINLKSSKLLLAFLLFILASTLPTTLRTRKDKGTVEAIKNTELPYFDTSYQSQSNHKCKRYAFLSGPNAGIGHMLLRIILGRLYALEKNATLVIDKAQFDKSGIHGSYPWAVEYFGLHQILDITEVKLSSLRIIEESTWHSGASEEPPCDILFRSCDSCCSVLNRTDILKASWCYQRKHWALAASRNYFFQLRDWDGKKHSTTPSVLSECWSNRLIDVIWHVRNGDLTLMKTTRKPYIDQVMKTIYNLFDSQKVQLYILSEESTASSDFHPWFEIHGAKFIYDLNVKDSLDLMIQCSVLVTSGSSFPVLATFFKSQETISFQSEPKEGTGTLDIFQHAILNEKGVVTYPSFDLLQKRAKAIVSRLSKYMY